MNHLFEIIKKSKNNCISSFIFVFAIIVFYQKRREKIFKKNSSLPLDKVDNVIIIVGTGGGKWGMGFKGKEERMYFIGNDIYSVDHKGRVFVPAKFRSVLSEEDEGSFYIARGFETSLLLFPLSGWNEFVKELSSKKYSQKSIREAIRAFSYAAERLSMDSQGRIVLPKELRDYSKIEEEVFFLGAIDKIELWSPSVYEKYSKGSSDINELYSKLGM